MEGILAQSGAAAGAASGSGADQGYSSVPPTHIPPPQMRAPHVCWHGPPDQTIPYIMSPGHSGCLPAEPPSWSATTVVHQGNLGGVTVEEEAPAAQHPQTPQNQESEEQVCEKQPRLIPQR